MRLDLDPYGTGVVLLIRSSYDLQWPGRSTRIDPATGWLIATPLPPDMWSTAPDTWADWTIWGSYEDHWADLPDTWAQWGSWAA